MFTATIFIIVLGILVLVHELGHFVMAKRAGMKVEEFGFGFPPRLLAWRRRPGADIEIAFGTKSLKTDNSNNTIFSINLVPFGGFVKIFGEDSGEEAMKSSRSFSSKKAGVKVGVIIGGVAMNLILAFVLLSFGNILGLRVGLEDGSQNAKDPKVQIIQIVPNSPAALAKIEVLDEIIGFNLGGQNFETKTIEKIQNFINSHKGQQLTVLVRRGKELVEKEVVPRVNPPENEGALGISMALTGVIKYPWHEAVYRGGQQTGILLINTVYAYGNIIKKVFLTGYPGIELSGPIGIAKFTGQAARIGFAYLIQLTAILSINLAILNIIPFPALDGGRLLFIIVEKFKGSPIPRKVENLANSLGFALLILLMIYVTTKDVIRFF